MAGTDNSRRPLRRVTIGLVVAAMFIAAVPYASAQSASGSTIDDGEYGGVIGISGTLRSAAVPDALVIEFDGTGSIEFLVEEGVLFGEWFLPMDTTIEGSMGEGQAKFEMSGSGTTTAEGNVGGEDGNYSMGGTYEGSQSVTVSIAGVTRTNSTSDSGDVDVDLTDIVSVCDKVTGRWDFGFKQSLEGQPIIETVRGYFTAWSSDGREEQSKEAESLIGDINSWAGSVAGVESGAVDAYVSDGLALLDRAQRLQAEGEGSDDCPDDKEFLTEMSLAAQDAVDSIVSRYPEAVGPELVALATGSAAAGEGSPAPKGAEALQAKLETAVNDTFDSLSETMFDNAAEVVDLAVSAQMLGMETMGSSVLSPSDVLNLVEA